MKQSNRAIWIVTAIVLTVGLGVGAYFLFRKPSNKTGVRAKDDRRITFQRN